MESFGHVIVLIGLTAVGLWFFLKRCAAPVETDRRGALIRWARSEGLPGLEELIRQAEQVKAPQPDQSVYEIEYGGQTFVIVAYANGSIQDAHRLAETLRQARAYCL